MTPLDDAGFAWFMRAVHGHDPFPWQQRLVSQLLDGEGWPDLLDLPTGTGKTSVLDIAVYALAASTPQQRQPRRMVFVVDRRVIVDQTAAHARRLADALAGRRQGHGGQHGRAVVEAVADGLLRQGGDDDAWPLHTAVLRGGMPRDGSWALRPDQATIVVSTVDQVGSRLLFDGYGVSDRMAPVHAGLLGVDALFLLDEVHLSRPFAETLRTVRSAAMGVPGVARLAVVELSATPGRDEAAPERTRFRLGADDTDRQIAPELVRRLTARRPARLVDAKGSDVGEAMAAATVDALPELEGDTHAVVVNRVATARTVHRRLLEELPDATVLLLTGRMRPLDRDVVFAEHLPRLRAGRVRPGPGDEPRPRLVLVATQTVEAGADLDLDGLLTEIAPVDSLRQRFGRLDRLGRAADAGITPRAVVIAPRAAVKAKDPDPVYGDAVRATHDWLRERFGTDEFDVSPTGDLPPDPPPETLAPFHRAPLLLPHHVALLSQTAPRPATTPPVDLWLHGDRDPDHDVTVVWRSDVVYPDGDRDAHAGASWDLALPRVRASLELSPPAPGEAMAVGAGALRAFAESRGADVVVRWGGRDSVDLARLGSGSGSGLRPGDTVVVPTTWGGVRAHTWDPTATAAVTDHGVAAGVQLRGRVVVRLVDGAVPDTLRAPHGLLPEDEDVRDRIHAWLRQDAVSSWLHGWGADVPARPSGIELRWLPPHGDGPSDLVVAWWAPRIGPAGPDAQQGVGPSDPGFDGSDDVNSFTSSGVLLADHGSGVGRVAARFASRAGLPAHLQEDLGLAGRLHDLGKADPRFQRMLVGGWPGSWAPGQPLLAKSAFGDLGAPEARAARHRSGYPPGARHEVTSVALVETIEDLRARAHDWDLVLHLVASHHGTCRPFAPPVDDPRPQTPVRVVVDDVPLASTAGHGLQQAGSGIADRFWRVQDRYGVWGTAYLETVLRLADHRRSAWERERA